MGIPCYVSGKGMHATDRTRKFKVEVIEILEALDINSRRLAHRFDPQG